MGRGREAGVRRGAKDKFIYIACTIASCWPETSTGVFMEGTKEGVGDYFPEELMTFLNFGIIHDI